VTGEEIYSRRREELSWHKKLETLHRKGRGLRGGGMSEAYLIGGGKGRSELREEKQT